MAQHILLIMQVLYIFHLISHVLRVLKHKSILFKVSIKMNQKFAEQGKSIVFGVESSGIFKVILSKGFSVSSGKLFKAHFLVLTRTCSLSFHHCFLLLFLVPCLVFFCFFVLFYIPLSSWGFSFFGGAASCFLCVF